MRADRSADRSQQPDCPPPTKVTVGTMNFGGRTPEAEARRIVDVAIDRGATFFDTANVYGDGASERILGEALKGRRHRVGIATKVGLLRKGGKPEGLAPETIVAALDESLARLQTDYVDLYYLHVPAAPSVPRDAMLDALSRLLEQGKIRAWGVSNHASWQILELNGACDALGMARPSVSQVLYNLLVRQLDVEYFAFARAHPIHTTVYNPLAGGLLARTPEVGAPVPAGSRFAANKLYLRRYWSDPLFELTAKFRALAEEHGLELVTLAYAWLARRAGVDSILVGPGTVEHLTAALAAVEVKLPAEVIKAVDDIHQAFLGTDAKYMR